MLMAQGMITVYNNFLQLLIFCDLNRICFKNIDIEQIVLLFYELIFNFQLVSRLEVNYMSQ